MRAAVLKEYATVPVVEGFDLPEPGEDEELVEVVAAGLNPVDRSIASGTFYAGSPPLPTVVGREGIVRRADGTRHYTDGAVAPSGLMAEQAVVRSETLVALPEAADPYAALAFGIAGLAGWLALEWRAQLQPGETVIVLGASGTVGLIAVQAAKLLGAGLVIAAARSETGLQRCARHGADAVVQLGGDDDAAALRDAAGEGGADVVVDPVWGAPAAAALTAMRFGGRLIQLGQSAGAEATFPSGLVRGRMLEIRGHTNFAAPAAIRADAFLKMVRHHTAGELHVDVERVPLAELPDAWERQGESPGTKLVVVP